MRLVGSWAGLKKAEKGLILGVMSIFSTLFVVLSGVYPNTYFKKVKKKQVGKGRKGGKGLTLYRLEIRRCPGGCPGFQIGLHFYPNDTQERGQAILT